MGWRRIQQRVDTEWEVWNRVIPTIHGMSFCGYRINVKVKVKQSRYRPGVAQRFPES
jgi:hypothetical protein